MNADPRPTQDSPERPSPRFGAMILPFSVRPSRRLRREDEDTAPRGDILLFTGVRYERMAPDLGAADETPAADERRRQPS
ncbi:MULTISPECIES: hypothetical protein [unclassified Methylobacterium]|uniref:hypothetical protein n=1 Tax=unclassified Methylobacterium TaxID=2615210 RepID=UPI000AADE81D|nr:MULTISPECIES: hypothetical protein [unclassified Methylobacterium]